MSWKWIKWVKTEKWRENEGPTKKECKNRNRGHYANRKINKVGGVGVRSWYVLEVTASKIKSNGKKKNIDKNKRCKEVNLIIKILKGQK